MYLPAPARGRIDRVICKRCGHFVWEHHRGGVCAGCNRNDASSACAETVVHAIEERAFQR